GGSSHTIATAAGLTIPNGTGCTDYVSLASSNPGTPASISIASGTVNGDYWSLSDVTAGGGATFNATNSIASGDVTGWNITGSGGVDFYWIAGTGNWGDASSWSLSSGGPAGTCVPSILDDVHFDVNSFSSPGQIVTVDVTSNSKNMDWTGATNTPVFAGWQTLNINGSMTLISAMTITYGGQLHFISAGAGNTITTPAPLSWVPIYLDGSGTYSLTGNLSTQGPIYFNNGVFNTADFDLTITGGSSFYSNSASTRTLNLGSSAVNVGGWSITNSTGMTLNAGTSDISLSTSAWTFAGGDLTYYDVSIDASFGVNMTGSNTFNTLTLLPGANLMIANGETQIIDTFSATGTLVSDISIMSDVAGLATTISQASGTFCGEYLVLQDVTATGGATFIAENSTDNGNNTGWTFGSCIPVSITDLNSATSLSVYPNPTRGRVRIESKGMNRVMVFSLSGKMIRSMSVRDNVEIDLSNETNGV
ncbi:MAG: T9SS type A sorting domain-containing protein, partial [Bacteroidetes bacterium]|nr:T9SS type A sorting domain-containing protein [Bacteroidota bacterium]